MSKVWNHIEAHGSDARLLFQLKGSDQANARGDGTAGAAACSHSFLSALKLNSGQSSIKMPCTLWLFARQLCPTQYAFSDCQCRAALQRSCSRAWEVRSTLEDASFKYRSIDLFLSLQIKSSVVMRPTCGSVRLAMPVPCLTS